MFSASKTAGPSGYNISRSVRLRSSASAYLNRTPASAGNQHTWTLSIWIKRGTLGAQVIYNTALSIGSNSNLGQIYFDSNNKLNIFQYTSSTPYTTITTTQVFRDPSAWYHIVITYDDPQATAANRVKMFVNGAQITAFDTASYPTQNFNGFFNGAQPTGFGRDFQATPLAYFDGYLTEINFIDGQALTPSSFGSTNATTGVWQPAKYTGTYGTNGFYLNFSDNSAATAAAIGKDSSGNGNNWTPNNISVTAGTTYDSMIDVPTPYADGSTGRGNYATFNPTIAASTGVGTITNGNLQCVTPTASASNNYGTIGVSTSKWYWEITITARTTDSHVMIGINDNTQSATEFYSQAKGYAYRGNGEKWNNGSGVAYGSSAATGDIIGVAFDADAGSIEFYKNGVSMGVAFTGITSSTYFPAICDTGTSVSWTATANFGQRPFSYTPPSGFKALNTYNLPASTITNGGKYMAATLYTGTGASQSVTNAGSFKPDLVWIKSRSAATDHKLTDSVRGTTKALISDTTGAETTDTNGLTAFGSAGFTVGSDTTYNNNTATYVGWQWQAGQGSTSSNTSGSITSTVSVNQTAGFSIVTYTGTGANATVGHGLGVAPSMMIIKSRSSAVDWLVYHAALGNPNYIVLNTTAAAATNAAAWNNTSPTSSVFTVGTGTSVNANAATYVAYCWAQIAGFSKFGSYTGNGSADGPFVYCGFRPRFVMVKRTDNVGDWWIFDTSRDTYNVMTQSIFADTSGAETNNTATFDYLSNGFKLRIASFQPNSSGGTFIFAAFAENPFANALAR